MNLLQAKAPAMDRPAQRGIPGAPVLGTSQENAASLGQRIARNGSVTSAT
jgi:hypothetical protein